MKTKQLIVTYGTLSRGFNNNHLLDNEHSKFIRRVETPPKYSLYDVGFPIAVRGGDTSIKGELWEISSNEVLKSVHNLEGFSGSKGNSKNWYDIDEIKFEEGEAIIYVMDNTSEGNLIPDGDWIKKHS